MIRIKKERVLVTPEDIKPSSKDFEVLGTFNPGAARLPNKNIILYVRVLEKLIKDEDEEYCYSPRMVGKDSFMIKIDKFHRTSINHKSDLNFILKDGRQRFTYISHLRRVILDKKGFKVKSIDKKPSFFGLAWDGELGIEDARITRINDLYIMTYVTLSVEGNVSTSYAISNDCINWYRRGIIFGEQNKDVVIIPEMIDNKYVAFNRPEGSFHFTLPHIWISYSPDLEFWGNSEPVHLSKKRDWDRGKKGAGPPPIKTEKGWLLLYHAIKEHKKIKKKNPLLSHIIRIFRKEPKLEGISCYNVGAALFNLRDPKKLIAKSKLPIIRPVKKYETKLFESKMIVFPTGLIKDQNGKDLLIFSGGGDSVTTVKKVGLDDIFEFFKKVR